MLDSHQWNFATKRVALALLANYVSPDNRWRYAYALPSDVANVISVLPQSLYPAGLTSADMDYLAFDVAIANYWGYQWPFEWELESCGDFQIEVINGQPAVVTNACDAIMRYSCNTVQPGQFSALFTEALAWKLASMLAGPLLKGDAGAAESKRCLEMHAIYMKQAMVSDANQRHGNYKPVPSNIVVRQ